MGALCIVLLSPLLDYDRCLATGREPFAIQTLVTELAVKAFDEPILPGMAGCNETGTDMLVMQPLLDQDRRKLTAVIRPEELRRTVLLHRALQHGSYIGRANRGRDMNRQTFASEFIQDAQGFEEPAIRQPIKQDVVCPDMVAMRGLLWSFVTANGPWAARTRWPHGKSLLFPEAPARRRDDSQNADAASSRAASP